MAMGPGRHDPECCFCDACCGVTPTTTPPRWRRKKPDKPGFWLLYRPHQHDHANRFMTVEVTQQRLDDGTVEQWTADWWCRLPEVGEL